MMRTFETVVALRPGWYIMTHIAVSPQSIYQMPSQLYGPGDTARGGWLV